MKRCTRCGDEKPLDGFFVDRRNSDGRFGRCRVCVNEAARARKDANPALRRAEVEWNRRYRKTDAGRAARRREYENGRERTLERVARWQRENPERRAANARAYVTRHPERRKATSLNLSARRRAAQRVTVGVVTGEAVAARVAFWGGCCWMCGGEWSQIDHVKPLTKGGSHMPANLRPICGPCNRRKSNRWPFALQGAAS